MSLEKVKEYLAKYNREKDIIEFTISTATVELAAEALSTQPERIAKTLSLYDAEAENCLLLVTAGDAKINNRKFKDRFVGTKARMLLTEDVERLTGHTIGGVCPFGNPIGTKVYLDVSLKRFETVFPACGSANSLIEMTLEELYSTSKAIDYVDVCKSWND